MLWQKIKNFLKKFIPHKLVIFFWHWPRAFLANIFFGFPARNFFVIGVAGSKGKTTTSILIAKILEKAQKKVALFTTALTKINEIEELNKVKFTTPSPFYLQKFIARAKKRGANFLILETTSHALAQFRVWGIPFKIVVFTNLVPDHLDYHKKKEEYIKIHQKMLPASQYLVLNADDPNSEYFANLDLKHLKKIFFGINQKRDIFAENISFQENKTLFEVKNQRERFKIEMPLVGKFNLYNALSAIAVSLILKIDSSLIKEILRDINQIPGRLERINCGQDFEVIVDYAHSPDSLKNLFDGISLFSKKKIITVFGACGQRDKTTRPLMGSIIDKNSDVIIITNDDPYGENPEKIAQGVISGIKNKTLGKNLFKILDRKEAIKKAISLAEKGDLVLILGKGAEQWQIFKDKKIPWDDRKIAKEILLEYQKNKRG